jgi:hypothetical protein
VSASPRISRARVLDQLRVAARKGDRNALQIALGEMRTLAYSPRYWDKYLELLANPLARLADLLVIKQGDRIADQKGWPRRRGRAAKRPEVKGSARPAARRGAAPARRGPGRAAPAQPSLFPDWS